MAQQNEPELSGAFLAIPGVDQTIANYRAKQIVFARGDPADAVFYVQRGQVKLTVVSTKGKEAVLSLCGAHDFFGECCLAGRSVRMSTASALTDCSILRIEKNALMDLLRPEPAFSEVFRAHLLTRMLRIEEDLADRFFNSSEKRLARILLGMAGFGRETAPEPVIPRMSQETLANMVGTTRSRVNFFLNKFRKLGYISYVGDSYKGDLEIHPSLLTLMDEQPADDMLREGIASAT